MSNPQGKTSMPRTSDPIKGYSHKGFIAGWCAIILVGITGFSLLTLPLAYSSTKPQAHSTQAGLVGQAGR